MLNKSFAEEMASSRLILAGIKANAPRLGKRGIDDQFITELEELYTAAVNLNSEQEALKARLKEKTTALNKTVHKLHKKCSEAEKLIKIEIPKESWREYGIEDSK